MLVRNDPSLGTFLIVSEKVIRKKKYFFSFLIFVLDGGHHVLDKLFLSEKRALFSDGNSFAKFFFRYWITFSDTVRNGLIAHAFSGFFSIFVICNPEKSDVWSLTLQYDDCRVP